MRSEVNAYIGDRALVVKPRDYQREFWSSKVGVVSHT